MGRFAADIFGILQWQDILLQFGPVLYIQTVTEEVRKAEVEDIVVVCKNSRQQDIQIEKMQGPKIPEADMPSKDLVYGVWTSENGRGKQDLGIKS